MKNSTQNLLIFVAEDDPDDRVLLQEAFGGLIQDSRFQYFENGQVLIDHLRRLRQQDFPAFILLDLNMPILNGFDTLKILKNDPLLKVIPVLILTTSSSAGDIWKSYQLGTNSYFTKPHSLDGFVNIARSIETYWLETARLPTGQ